MFPMILGVGTVLCLMGSLVARAVGVEGVSPVAQYPALPSETPPAFKAVTGSFDYERREAMIAMRDGVRLYTVILVPKGARRAPILLTRTPYNAKELSSHANSPHLGSILYGYDNAVDTILDGGYIRVLQDIRGKYGSEGDYVMNRPLHGPQNPTPVDESTDTYDTIEWLVHNLLETNGRVGTLGISYDGFLPLMAVVHPHPALKVSVPMNPMVDGWMGDDWFHNGAFRAQNLPYIHDQVATRDNSEKWWSGHHDDYDLYLEAGSAGELARRHGLEQIGFWQKVVAHPAYDAFWRDQAVDKILAADPPTVPMMLVHSLWDQEDIYGALAVYRALKPLDSQNNKVFLVMGPWYHGQEIEDPSGIGAIHFGSNTGRYFEREVLLPFLDHYLKDNAPAMDVAPVTAFETGTNVWRKLPAWPVGCASGCTVKPTPLYLSSTGSLKFTAPLAGTAAFDEYLSDPAKPVPYRARPIQPVDYGPGKTWSEWLVDDQREASGRTDVLTYTSEVLTTPLKISGTPLVHLVASTSGTDADWVVKLIDVYPDEVPAQPALGGYQLMVAADILRGRYRESFETAKPIAANKPLVYQFPLPTANHVFLPGHRLMVQVQSSWFPLYDRNPQTFVPNIFLAKPADYRSATMRVYHAADNASYLELPIATH
jgi:putative CocE/NonD family hydrolase